MRPFGLLVAAALALALVPVSRAEGFAFAAADREAVIRHAGEEGYDFTGRDDAAAVLGEAASPRLAEDRLRARDPYATIEIVEAAGAPQARFGLDLIEIGGRVWAIPRAAVAEKFASGATPVEILAINGAPVEPDLTIAALAERLGAAAAEGPAKLAHRLADGTRGETRLAPFVGAPPAPHEVRMADGLSVIRLYDTVRGETALAVRDYLFALDRSGQGLAVLDLRFAEGGDLYEAVDTAAHFLSDGEVSLRRRLRGGRSDLFTAARSGAWAGRPVVVLISARTASAAEYIARALAAGGAVTAGQPSYGKCRVQTLYDLPSGGQLALTTSELLAPDGSECERRPIMPDVELSLQELMSPGRWRAAIPALTLPPASGVPPEPATSAPPEAGNLFVCAAEASPPGPQTEARLRLLAIAVDVPDRLPILLDAPGTGGTAVTPCFGPMAAPAADRLAGDLASAMGEAFTVREPD